MIEHTFVKATETRFQMTADRQYLVTDGCLTDDCGLRRDAGGLVAAGVARWCDKSGQDAPPPAPSPLNQHYAAVYDTEVILLTGYARQNALPLAILVDAGRVVVNMSAAPWAAPIVLGARQGIAEAGARLRSAPLDAAR